MKAFSDIATVIFSLKDDMFAFVFQRGFLSTAYW